MASGIKPEGAVLREHPQRREVVGEMHLRRWPALVAPVLVIQILRLVSDDERRGERDRFADLPAGASADWGDNPKHLSGTFGPGIAFVWEAHTEATAFTLFVSMADGDPRLPGVDSPPVAAALAWAGTLPGEAIRATRMVVVADEAGADGIVAALDLAETELVSCRVGGGARIWTDFGIGADGFGRMVVAANGMTGADLARLAQRLQELGDYRNLALLGLPVAQGAWGEMNRIEAALRDLAADVSRLDVTDDALLERVSTLSLDLMSISAATSFRMSATRAYAQLVEERLSDLAQTPVGGFQSLGDFTQRRLWPAVRTCAAHSRREAELSERTARFTSLLRTRIETRIENQNARLLESMERSASLQLRLQQLVEGLSVVALSYYCIGLLGYVLKGAEAGRLPVPAAEILAIATPLVVVGAAVVLHRVKRRMLGPH